MRRINTVTAVPDSDGRNGFTYGTPGVSEATEVSADWLNAIQEEVANAVEQAGDTLDSSNPLQLSNAIQSVLEGILGQDRGFAATGLVMSNPVAGLDIVVSPGVFFANGRQYHVTETQTVTVTDNDTRYIYIEPDDADPRGYVLLDSPNTSPDIGRALVGEIVTLGSFVTSMSSATEQSSTGPRWHTNQMVARAVAPDGVSATLGFSGAYQEHVTGRWANLYVREAAIGYDIGADGARDEETSEIVIQTQNGAGTDSHILVGTSGYADGDVVNIEVKTAGRRTDAVGGYSVHFTIGAIFETGAWTFQDLVSIHQESGSGGGVRDVRPTIDGSDRITLLMDIDNAEDWTFTHKVAILWNTAGA